MVLRLKSCTVRFDRHLPYANELKASSVAEDGIPRYIRQLRELRSCELVAMDMGTHVPKLEVLEHRLFRAPSFQTGRSDGIGGNGATQRLGLHRGSLTGYIEQLGPICPQGADCSQLQEALFPIA